MGSGPVGAGAAALARDHGMAGRVGVRAGARTRIWRSPRRAADRRGWWPRCGGSARVASSRSTAWSRRASRGVWDGFRATTVKIMQDGVCENYHGRDAGAVHRRRTGPVPGTPGSAWSNPSCSRRRSRGSTRRGSRSTSTRSGTAPCARRWTRARPRGPQTAPGTRGTTSPTSSSCIRTTCRGSRSWGSWRTASRSGRASTTQMDDLNPPVRRAERGRGSTRSRRSERAGARLAFGSDWPVSTANPLLEIEVAVTRVATDGPDAEPFLPGRTASTSRPAWTRSRWGRRSSTVSTITGTLEPGKSPTWRCSTGIRSRPSGPIGNARFVLTLVGGEVVYRAD